MELRKTILFIGNREEDREVFETAIAATGKQYQFLALDNEPYTISRMSRSQPFWFHAIFFDLSTPSIWGMSFLREIAAIRHQKHVPLIAYTDTSSRSYLATLQEAGATHCIQKGIEIDALVSLFSSLNRSESLTFDAHFLLKNSMQQNILQVA